MRVLGDRDIWCGRRIQNEVDATFTDMIALEWINLNLPITDGNVSKVVLTEAVKTCMETFTLSDFNDLEDSVSKAVLFDVANRQDLTKIW